MLEYWNDGIMVSVEIEKRIIDKIQLDNEANNIH
jgi:hypothetical protein